MLEEDDGVELYEVVAILRYLEGRFPTPALAPFDPRDQARLAQWIRIGQTELAPAIQQILSAGYADRPTVARWWKRVSARPVYEEIVEQMASQSSPAKT